MLHERKQAVLLMHEGFVLLHVLKHQNCLIKGPLQNHTVIPEHYSAHCAGPPSDQVLTCFFGRQTDGSREPRGHSS